MTEALDMSEFTRTDLKINAADKALWTAALDSGEHEQATGHLFDGKGYCCLGVLAKVKGCSFFLGTHTEEDDEGDEIETDNDSYTVLTSDNANINDSEVLNQDFADRIGLTKDHQNLLSNLNDGRSIMLMPDEPMHAICVKLGIECRTSPMLPDHEFVVDHKYSFDEISKIIKDHF